MILKAITSLAALAIPAALFAQTTTTVQATLDSPYQVNYASNLNIGDGVINITNSGSSATGTPIVNGNSLGDICVNTYVYAPDQELAACCTCLVSPNSLHSFPVSFGPGNLLSNVNNTTVLASINQTHSVIIKLLAVPASGIASNTPFCPSPASPGVAVGGAAGTTVTGAALGMVAWGTHSHPTNTAQAAITETSFVPSTLSAGELGKLTTDCSASLTFGSGRQCPGCLTGGLAVPAPAL